jgi:hypothetical protein
MVMLIEKKKSNIFSQITERLQWQMASFQAP